MRYREAKHLAEQVLGPEPGWEQHTQAPTAVDLLLMTDETVEQLDGLGLCREASEDPRQPCTQAGLAGCLDHRVTGACARQHQEVSPDPIGLVWSALVTNHVERCDEEIVLG